MLGYTHALAKNACTKKDLEMFNRHKRAVAKYGEQLAGRQWAVHFPSSVAEYIVELQSPCQATGCLRCPVCGVCRHMVSLCPRWIM